MRIDCCEYASYNETNTQQRQRKKKIEKKNNAIIAVIC